MIIYLVLKVLQLIQTRQNRGAETFACQLSNHIKKLGHDVLIVSIYDGDAELNFSGEIIALGANLKNRLYDFGAWKRLANIIDSFQPDIVQANAGDTLKYSVFSKVIFRWDAPIVVRNASEVGRYIRSFPQKLLNSFLYKKVDQIISVSKASEKDILNIFPFLKNKTSVITVGLEKDEDIHVINLKPYNTKHIVHVGGFSFEKNHKGLLKIFKIIQASKMKVHLHLIGDGPLRKEIENKAEKLGLFDKISFYGFVTNPLSYIKAADVLVLPSIIEGLPGVLIEAMYCKTPVVAYDVGGIEEIVNPDTGALIPLNDENLFANATIEVLRNPSQTRIDTAHQMVKAGFMNDFITTHFIEAYKQLLQR
ncbi:glycosyltransferase [Antarcticibacterium sp. 1MA-6-2]|uniref:glycosyltransferase n=1 Tax=Antarcticibacterium sp. 1MA-6-2 TaxID=2908210 RepID=UPI001F480433|nr:glycosyltransferase [Antarcticibacterium sp. 1MA-6-2]UJH91319.1 glycosyltransferase [Antarcticibacterium sp. 1MA-6-2]